MLKVLKLGLYTSIQDLGRWGFMKYGVPVSGAMDQLSAVKANLLLNNNNNCALIECTQQGPKLLFTKTTQIAICGADMSAQINAIDAPLNTLLNIKANDILHFRKLKYGYRTYIAVKGGFQNSTVLGSRSYFQPLTKSNVFLKDELIEYDTINDFPPASTSSIAVNEKHFNNRLIQVTKGPEFELLNKQAQAYLLNTDFTIGINNRMAYQLKELLPNKMPSILTSAILPGTVQLTPSGKILILMRDAQTNGGYPRIFNLSEAAINQLSQKRLADVVQFELKN